MKKAAVAATLVSAGLLFVAGCGSDSYGYEVSGNVEHRQVDYDCNGSTNAMTGALSLAGKPGGGSSRGRGSRGDSSGGKAPKGGSTAGSTGGAGRSTPDGVTLTKKPKKPSKVGGIDAPVMVPVGGSCSREYELFIRSGGDLYEQDVRKVDYEACEEREKFPACTDD